MRQNREIEARSPDGDFAFRYTAETESAGKAFELINRHSGKALVRIAEANLDPAPSERFFMKVLWRPDSQAFAVTSTLWKRGSGVSVYLREGATFREAKLPELDAEITDKMKAGHEYPHLVELNSQTAKRWQKDHSLVVEIENMQDGDGSTITALRTVVLGFDKSKQVKVLKSTLKVSREKS